MSIDFCDPSKSMFQTTRDRSMCTGYISPSQKSQKNLDGRTNERTDGRTSKFNACGKALRAKTRYTVHRREVNFFEKMSKQVVQKIDQHIAIIFFNGTKILETCLFFCNGRATLLLALRGVVQSLWGCEKSTRYKILHRSSGPKKF